MFTVRAYPKNAIVEEIRQAVVIGEDAVFLEKNAGVAPMVGAMQANGPSTIDDGAH